MPIKHQAASYRTRNGQKYMNEGDICDATFGALHIQAKARVQELREAGRKAFAERHPGGFYRVFVAQQKRDSPMPERTAKDYAIEFGGYLADAARNLQVAINSGDPDTRTDAWAALNSAIYEFEKRAARAKQKDAALA